MSKLTRAQSLELQRNGYIKQIDTLTATLQACEQERDALKIESGGRLLAAIDLLKQCDEVREELRLTIEQRDHLNTEGVKDENTIAGLREQLSTIAHTRLFEDVNNELGKARLTITELEQQVEQAKLRADSQEYRAEQAEGKMHARFERYQQLEQRVTGLEGALNEILTALQDHYDGAPDSPTRWMGAVMRQARHALGGEEGG